VKDNPDQLKKAIESQHGGTATLVDSVIVKEVWEGRTVWNGTVHVFELNGHPLASKAYAWSSPIEGGDKRKVFAVLHIPPVDSPQKAVQAAIVHEYRTEGGRK
jgi:hypothetical protein